jgi:hypothetical protein
MGRTYLYECPQCGYNARVAGGADRGFNFTVQTILCRDCKQLHDSVVQLKILDDHKWQSHSRLQRARLQIPKQPATGPPVFESALNRLPVPGGTPFKWAHFKIQCPVSATHRVQVWNEPGPCPKCATPLERNTLPFRIWD